MMELRSRTRFQDSMWRDLPADVLERVFTFLPIASLCRFRTLSKEWNSYLSSPTFKRARAADEEYVLITPRLGRPVGGGWVVLDVTRKRFFTLSDAFLTTHVQQQGLMDAAGAQARCMSYLAAADGGLFCVRYSFTVETSGLFVCNPVLKTVKQLPRVAGVGWGEFVREKVVMATDRSSMEYEVFIVHYLEVTPFVPERILVYESKTGTWKTAPYQPYFSQRVWWGTLTIFNNNQYFVVNKVDSSRSAGLVSYDKETGVVSDLGGIDFPLVSAPRGIDFPSARGSHLVVSNARLFCVIPVEDLSDDFFSVEIFELDVVERVSTRVTAMPRPLCMWILGNDLNRLYGMRESKILKVATGSADCILIATVLGRCAAYSFSEKTWYQFPDDRTLVEEYCQGDMTHEWFCGSNNCLSLCAP